MPRPSTSFRTSPSVEGAGKTWKVDCGFHRNDGGNRNEVCHMRAYIIRRLLLIIPTLFILTILVFLAVRLLPGDVIDATVNRMQAWGAGIEIDREAIMRYLGLDAHVHVQYGRWIGVLPTPDWVTGESHFKGLLQGTLGKSWTLSGFSIEEKIIGRLPVTIQLGAMAIVIGLVIAPASRHLLGDS